MTREINEDKEFSENIDRLLADQEVEAGEDMPEDFRTAIQFAQKLKGLRDESSPVFKDRLRRRLLLKMAEQEAEAERRGEKRASFWELLRNPVPRSHVWRTATATVVVAVVAIVVLWGSGTFTQAPEQWAEKGPAPAPAVAPPPRAAEGPPVAMLDSEAVLRLEPILGETNVYLLEEEVKIDLVFTNTSSESVVIVLFPPAIQINKTDTGEIVRSFPQGNERAEVSASGTLLYTLVWNQLDDNGVQVEPGRYSIVVVDIGIQKGTEEQESHVGFGAIADLLIESR